MFVLKALGRLEALQTSYKLVALYERRYHGMRYLSLLYLRLNGTRQEIESSLVHAEVISSSVDGGEKDKTVHNLLWNRF